MGALFHRERTGVATTVDVSLLGTGLWSMGQALGLSLQLGMPWAPPPKGGGGMGNPLVGQYQTKDGGFLSICCLQPGRYWAEACDVLGRPDLATDERFADAGALVANGSVARELLREVFAERTTDEWRERLASFSGQWTVVQHTLEVAADPQTVANGYVVDCETADGTPFQLAAAPVQFGETPAIPARAPEFNEHGDAILADLGLDWDTIVDLKVRGVVA
jgi:crotonobetainyl-CoA:carnitine CoA-transferase CaiB-like acyl-CoA transferase